MRMKVVYFTFLIQSNLHLLHGSLFTMFTMKGLKWMKVVAI